MRRLIICLFAYSIIVNQTFGAQVEAMKSTKYNLSSPSEFVFESYPNQELIPIRLLGAVKNAGLYHVPVNMKLTTLLSLAGGTNSEADLENIVIGNDQKSVVSSDGQEKASLNLNLEEVLKTGAKSDYTLASNDIVLVKNKSPLISNDSFRIISIVSVVLTALLTAVIIKDKIND
ncbi:MAG: SLBB domain-containing protein [Bdellovibrionales bacterium]|nr:SLBB domain-containing protein [Bdellovibrionales bacterium]